MREEGQPRMEVGARRGEESAATSARMRRRVMGTGRGQVTAARVATGERARRGDGWLRLQDAEGSDG